MAKKISKASKKPKLTRSSSIEKTIDEGKDYVTRADRRLRIRRTAPKPELPKQKKVAKKVAPKKAPKAAKVAKPRRRTTAVASRTSRPAVLSLPPPVVPAVVAPVAPVGTGVARTASRNVSRSGSKNLARSGSKNNQIIIEQELQDRLGRHNANIGKLNFSLRWWDPNDLDLHVICPCNT